MREIPADTVTQAVRDLCVEANTELPESHLAAMRRALEAEESPHGREVLERLLQNAEVARERCVAFCQDTGYAVFFVEMGSDVRITGGEIGKVIDEGVRRGYEEGYLRKSIVRSPIDAPTLATTPRPSSTTAPSRARVSSSPCSSRARAATT